MKETIINHFLNYEFVYIFVFCFVLSLFLSFFIKKQIIKKISLLCFSLFFVLFCFEFILSFYMQKTDMSFDRKYIRDINGDVAVYREIEIFDGDAGMCVLFNEEKELKKYKNYTEIFDVSYSIYNNDFRTTKCDTFSKETYVFLGCSFTLGCGLNDDETLPYYFSENFNFKNNVINCGVCGHSTNTSLNILNNAFFSPLIFNKQSNIKYFFYSLLSDHIYRNFRYGKIYGEDYDASDGYLYKNKRWYISTLIGKIKYIFGRSYIFRKVFVPVIDEKFKQYYENYMIQSLEKMNEIIEEKYNSKLAVIIWEKEWYSEYFIKKLKETKLDLIFLPEYFNSEKDGYRIRHDGHPTAKANKEIAEILYNHINEKDKTN